ncbi:portal protein [Phenylobacterium sp.]|uniref:portal protein n=1 Tax=Phenylobacterium sp. TaxID=1871053 RepID=UPI002DE5CDEC|nr:portal protein [Phenylobacterium sp.]
MADPAAPAIIGATREVDDYLRQFETLRLNRVDYDRKWQLVSDYILPRRDFSVTQRPNQLRPHRVTSSTATNSNTRLAALLLAYLVDPTRPFLLPNVKRGLAMAGRSTDLDAAGLDYLSNLEWSIFDHLMLPRAQLMLRLNSMLKEFCAFGCGVLWTGRRRGFGPYFNSRPVQACWWSENEEGVIDTLYFKMMLPLYRVFARWPAAAELQGWKQIAEKQGRTADEMELTSIVIACRPRPGGKGGAVAEAKPFAYVVIAEDKKAVIETSGYDSFPYSVFRYDPMPGQAYAEGPGCQVLPDVMVLNHLQQGIENSASQKAEPALAVPARMFGKSLDRRPGAINSYNPAGLGLQRADQAILKLDFTGNPTEAIAFRKELINDIEIGYFTDWLRLREAGDMTAEEVNERRDLRLRGMSSIVANCEQPMSVLGDRSLEALAAEGVLAPAPPSIAKADVDWEYAGPLAVAQLSGNVRSMLQLLNAWALTSKADPAAGQTVDLEESLRVIADGLGTPASVLRSRAAVAQARAQQAQQQQDQHQAEIAAKAGQAVGAAGQGMAAVAGAGQDQGAPPPPTAGGPPAPFAPASPFAQAA